jgi:hypothetical protein
MTIVHTSIEYNSMKIITNVHSLCTATILGHSLGIIVIVWIFVHVIRNIINLFSTDSAFIFSLSLFHNFIPFTVILTKSYQHHLFHISCDISLHLIITVSWYSKYSIVHFLSLSLSQQNNYYEEEVLSTTL